MPRKPAFDVFPFAYNLTPMTPDTVVGSALGVLMVFLLLIHLRINRISFLARSITAGVLILPAYFVGGFWFALLDVMMKEMQKDTSFPLGVAIGAHAANIGFLILTVTIFVAVNFDKKPTQPVAAYEWQDTIPGWASLTVFIAMFLAGAVIPIGGLIGLAVTAFVSFAIETHPTVLYFLIGSLGLTFCSSFGLL